MDDADGRADAAAECAAAMDAQCAAAMDAQCAALEAAVGRALEPLDARLRTQEAAVRAAQRSLSQAIHKLRTDRAAADEQLRTVRRQRQREQQEVREDKQWLAGVWPAGVPLPTMLQPFATVHSADDGARVADVADDHKRRRMEAMVNRRVQRERVVQRMEAAAMWTVVVPPVDGVDGVDAQPYYVHTATGETSWDAPAAMFYEPPEGWDAERMDWHPSWPLERFYPPADEPSTDREDEDEDMDDPDDTMDDEAVNEDADDAAADPVQLRREMERALTAHEQLTTQLADSKAKQRTLALQLLNASREAFENEKEAIAVEDKKVKDAERARRKVEAQEQAAARAKEAAAERRRLEAENPGQQFAKYARDSVTNKGLTLAKDDNALEKELEAFAAEQRADRAYLTSPVAVDGRARAHKRADDEYAHMKMLESEVQKQEQLEFDLLEKTSLRVEETTTKSEELQALAEEIRTQRVVIAEELAAVAHTITRLELPLEHPSIERPTSEELRRAEERFITVESQDEQDLDEDDNNETPKDDERETDSLPKVDPAAMSADERELVQLKSFVKVETQWRLWEKEEAMRVEELLAAQTRSQSLMTSDRSLAVDLAMCEADEIFFGKLKELEKAGNTRMWTNQADAQVERARFMIERAAREESEYQLQDRVAELQVLLEEARRLPLRALNAVHRLELERESDQHVAELTEKLGDANRQLDKEKQARKLLQKLELRSTEYFGRKLDEEAALFQDKQALWDLSARLVDEIQADRLTIARLYELMDSTDSTDEIKEQPQLTVVNDASGAFEVKLQLLQHVREFLLASYERDARWRELAAMALIPDSTSAEWMTAAQNARHGKMLATLAEQYAEREAELQRELKLRARIEEQLHSELVRASSKADRQREEYEDAFACVHTQTQAALAELQQEICALKAELTDERSRFNEDKQRLITHHDQVRLELETRNRALERVNEDQRHWLTAAKRELTAQRVANDELVKSAQALEKRRASEVNDLRFRVAAQVKKINTIEMWNLAMKIKSKEANAERVRMLREFAVKTEQHRELQRLLRLANWRHRVAAQAILSNVDWLFAFFADGLEVLAGATESSNDALRRNAGVQVLSVLAAHSSQPRVQQICARALGRLAWNENVTPRALGWAAATLWSRWVRERSDEVLADLSSRGLEFDAEASEDATSFNWLDDPPKVADAEVIARKKLRFIRSWLRVEDFAWPSENAANQEFIGLTPGVLQVLVDLCGPSVDDLKLRRHALESLALVAMNTRNTAVVGRMDGVIRLLSCLIRPPSILDNSSSSSGHLEDWEVVRCAVRAIGNLAFENRFNQQGFVQEDVVRQLLSYCSLTDNNDSLDVDLVLASVQALTNIIHEYVAAGERLVASGGISILARLCNSPLVHDAVELEVAEAIHAHAALVLSTAVTLLDEEACEGDERATYAAGLVMKEGVDPFVLMCASCNRDVALHGALVLGTIARRDDVRAAIGSAGGVDALFLLIDSRPQDSETTAVAAWAIANLTWHRENQYRVARYMSTLLRLCSTPSLSSAEGENPCERVHALCAFANTLFYNEASRQLVARDTRWLVLLERICVDEDPGEALQHAARALCALSYSDELALAMGVDDNNHAEKLFPFNGLALFLRLAGRPTVGVEVQRLALFGIVNLVLHDVNKPRVLRVPLAIETLVNLSAHDAPEVREPATEALELLADVRSVPPEVMESPVTGQTSEQLRRLVALLEDDKSSSAAVSMAADAIADEAWKRPNAKARLRNARAIEALLTRSRADTTSPAAVVSCLWAVRNVVADNPRNQDVAGALDAVTTLVGLLDQRRHRFVDERGADRGEDVAEATLAALVAVVLRHPRNSQELVRLGLDVLLAIAEEKRDVEREETQQPRKTEIAALATELLEIVAPHNAPVLPVIDRKAGASPDKAKLRARHGPTALPTLAPR